MTTALESTRIDEIHACIRREIASIGALEAAIAAEKHPGYVTLFREAKSDKQAAVEQLATLARRSGAPPTESAFLAEGILKAETRLASARRTLLFDALRAAENTLVEEYTRLAAEQPEGLEKSVFASVRDRAVKRWHILTAHIARESGDAEALRALPRTLEEYFAAKGDRVCMRCLFDRPGALKSLVRSSPDPETYVCSACHDEVLAGFPPDLQPRVERAGEARREALVIERALGRPEVLTASRTVIARLSGLESEPPPRTRTPVQESRQTREWAVDELAPDIQIPTDEASPSERAYEAVLFDPSAVARSW